MLWVIPLLALVLGGTGFGGLIVYAKYKSSSVELLPLGASGSSVVYARDGKTVLARVASAEAGKQLTDQEMPELVRQTHMAAEDREFYNHGAISLKGMAGAFARDMVGLSFHAGGSTIYQQQAKKSVGSEKSIQRKIDELPYAYRLEHDYTKPQVLNMYCNSNYYGRGVYGVADAAQVWFGISAKNDLKDMKSPLAVARAAFLAALIQQPSWFDDYKGLPSNLIHGDQLWARVRYVLDGLRELKGLPAGTPTVSEDVIARAKELLPLKVTNTKKATGNPTAGDPFLVAYIRDWMAAWQTEVAKEDDDKLSNEAAAREGDSAAERMLARGGLKIQTCIDAGMQNALVGAHKSNLPKGKSGAIAMDPRDGCILAMSGGRDYDTDPFNYAMYASRPPGSTMKPFVLADAVSQGISANSVFAAPASIKIDGPAIFDHTKRAAPGCKMTLADALAESNNVVYVEAATGKMAACGSSKLAKIADYPVTPSTLAEFLRKAGADASPVPKRDSPAKISAEPRLGIGSGTSIELSPLKLAVMSSSLATGKYHKPSLVKSITAGKESLFAREDESHDVLDEEHVRIVTKAMAGVFTHGTAVDDQVPRHPLAGKTGTLDTELGDSWMFAFNAIPKSKSNKQRVAVCAAWNGRNPRLAGADTGKVCQAFFGEVLQNTATVNFPKANLNDGKLVGLKQDPPALPPATTTTPSSKPTPSPSATSETLEPNPSSSEVSSSATPRPSRSRSVAPPEQDGDPPTGTAPAPGRSAQQGAFGQAATTNESEAPLAATQ